MRPAFNSVARAIGYQKFGAIPVLRKSPLYSSCAALGSRTVFSKDIHTVSKHAEHAFYVRGVCHAYGLEQTRFEAGGKRHAEFAAVGEGLRIDRANDDQGRLHFAPAQAGDYAPYAGQRAGAVVAGLDE